MELELDQKQASLFFFRDGGVHVSMVGKRELFHLILNLAADRIKPQHKVRKNPWRWGEEENDFVVLLWMLGIQAKRSAVDPHCNLVGERTKGPKKEEEKKAYQRQYNCLKALFWSIWGSSVL